MEVSDEVCANTNAFFKSLFESIHLEHSWKIFEKIKIDAFIKGSRSDLFDFRGIPYNLTNKLNAFPLSSGMEKIYKKKEK